MELNIFKNLNIETNEGLSDREILMLEEKNQWVIPDFYKEILKYSDGIVLDEGDINFCGSKYLNEINKTYEITEYLPGYLAIGNTGGGYVLIVKQEKDEKDIYVFGSGSLFLGFHSLIVKNVEKWFMENCPLDDIPDNIFI